MQLYGPIRKETADSHSVDLDRLQTAQNNMLRTLENVRISDKVSAKSLLERNQMLSVNQTAAQIKLMEMWKSKNIESYPLKPEIVLPIHNGATNRNATCEKFKTNNTPSTFIGDATRLWNSAPITVTNTKTILAAKKSIKTYCSSLPI